jgi:type VI secretion system protein ImpK
MSDSLHDDPFASLGGGRTFVKPVPAREPAAAAPRATGPDVAADIGFGDSGLNPLVAVANRVLALVPQIRATHRLADPSTLRESIAHTIREFEAQARSSGIAPERIVAARYVLCTLVDEVAARMPWGGSGQWGRHSLLAMFHNETGGGEKVFQLMAKLAQNPAPNRDLLELIYAALCLGFEGRYGAVPGGAAQIEAVRERLAQIVRKERGDHPRALAEHWQGVAPPRRHILTWIPLWVSVALAGLLLAAVYLLLSWRLGDASDPVYARIQSLRFAPPPAVARPFASGRLAPLLQAEIQAGWVAVRDELDRSIVTVRGDGLFAPASATLAPERAALMQRIAAALARTPGAVIVSGHTDDVPIRTARFPSNWHLSEERARTVRDLLVAAGLDGGRVVGEGRAEAEPVAPNDTAANRALNRRVEITLRVPAAGTPS